MSTNPEDLNLTSAAGHASYYDALWKKFGTSLSPSERSRASFTVNSIRKYASGPNLKILDLGCGRGWLSQFLAPLGEVTGVDFSPTGIDFAEATYGKFGHFVLANANSVNYGFERGTLFDVVVSSEVIEHVEDHNKYAEQLNSMLRVDGLCVLTTPNGNVWDRFRSKPEFAKDLQPVEHWLTVKQLSELLYAKGFHVLRHIGSSAFEFRFGVNSLIQRPRVARAFERARLANLYGRLVRPCALYQFIAARKIANPTL